MKAAPSDAEVLDGIRATTARDAATVLARAIARWS